MLYLKTVRQSGRTLMSGQETVGGPKPTAELTNTVEVVIRHSGVESRILGSPEGVLRELLSYFSKVYQSIELVSRLLLSTDNAEFLQNSAGVLGVSPEGLVILKNVGELRDKELIMLHLSGSRLTHLMGRKDSDAMSLEEITKATGRSTGTVAGRLSELCNEQLVERVGKGAYRLTTMGTRVVVKTLMPRAAQFPDK